MEQAIAKPRYPILLLHGVGFRDWKWPLYWGRIPGVLTDMGCELFYGQQGAAGRRPSDGFGYPPLGAGRPEMGLAYDKGNAHIP